MRAKSFPFDRLTEWWSRFARISLQKYPAKLCFPHPILGKLFAARSDHGDFAAYHEHFKHEDAKLYCNCGKRKAPKYFNFCPKGRRASWRTNWYNPKENICYLLTSLLGAKDFASWIEETQFFTNICPM